MPTGDRRLSIHSRSSARASTQGQGKGFWSGVRNLVNGPENDEEHHLPAWKLLETSGELDIEVDMEASKRESQEAPPTKASSEYSDSFDHVYQDVDRNPTESNDFEGRSERRGLLSRVQNRVGAARKVVGRTVIKARKRVWPWSDRNKMIRTQKRLDKIERAQEGSTKGINEQPGLLGRLGRTFRRRLLNVFDFGGEEAQQWAKTMSKRGSEISVGTSSRTTPLEEEFSLLQSQFQAVEFTRAGDLPRPALDGGRQPSTAQASVKRSLLSVLRNGALGALYWSVGKEYQPPVVGDEGSRRGVLRRKIQVRSPNPAMGSVFELEPKEEVKKGSRNPLASIVRGIMRERADSQPRSLQGQFGDKLTPEGRLGGGRSSDRLVNQSRRVRFRERIGDSLAPPFSAVGRFWRRINPFGPAATVAAATNLQKTGFAVQEPTAVGVSGNSSSNDGGVQEQGRAVDLAQESEDKEEEGATALAREEKGAGREPEGADNTAQTREEPLEIDPTDVDSQSGPRWPWSRFYGNRAEECDQEMPVEKPQEQGVTKRNLPLPAAPPLLPSSFADKEILRPNPLDRFMQVVRNTTGNAIGSLKLPQSRNKREEQDESEEILRQRDEILRLQAEVSRRRKQDEEAKLREKVGEVGEATAKVFPVSAKVLSVLGGAVNAVGQYVPGVARASRLVSWIGRKVNAQSVTGSYERDLDQGDTGKAMTTLSIGSSSVVPGQRMRVAGSGSGVLTNPSLSSFVDVEGVQGFPVIDPAPNTTLDSTEASDTYNIDSKTPLSPQEDEDDSALSRYYPEEASVWKRITGLDVQRKKQLEGDISMVLENKVLSGDEAPGDMVSSRGEVREEVPQGAEMKPISLSRDEQGGVDGDKFHADAPVADSGYSNVASRMYSDAMTAAQMANSAFQDVWPSSSSLSPDTVATPPSTTSSSATLMEFSERVERSTGLEAPAMAFPSPNTTTPVETGKTSSTVETLTTSGAMLQEQARAAALSVQARLERERRNFFSSGGSSSSSSSSSTTKPASQPPESMDVTDEVRVNKNLDRIPDSARELQRHIPVPTLEDFEYIAEARIETSVSAANAITTDEDGKEYLKDIGVGPLVTALTMDPAKVSHLPGMRLQAVKGLCRLVRADVSAAATVAREYPQALDTFAELIDGPNRGFVYGYFRRTEERDYEELLQYETTALVQRMVRSSDGAVEVMSRHTALNKALTKLMRAPGDKEEGGKKGYAPKKARKDVYNTKEVSLKPVRGLKPANITKVIDYKGVKVRDMARVAAWGLGGVKWEPRQPNQKGLRILSFDGGGTKGVLAIAVLKEIVKAVGTGQQPFEMFDIICGTSTGGIIATILGLQQKNVEEMEVLYDEFIGKVFGKGSNIKLVSEKAFYDESELEKVLYDICGEELLLDSNLHDCPRVFCVSTKVDVNPPKTQIWRNYNYPPAGPGSRYPGTFRVNTLTAVRATTAAPTFFTPVQWENGLYCDGALVANNPCAIALQEAKNLFPGVPIEAVVSIGTGYNIQQSSSTEGMGWDLLTSVIINSSTDTEDVDRLLMDFLPPDTYFRFNPTLEDNVGIDVKDKKTLDFLKEVGARALEDMSKTPEGERRKQAMLSSLRGGK